MQLGLFKYILVEQATMKLFCLCQKGEKESIINT